MYLFVYLSVYTVVCAQQDFIDQFPTTTKTILLKEIKNNKHLNLYFRELFLKYTQKQNHC